MGQHKESHKRFATLDYEAFKELASDRSLSASERIGFPDEYRDGFEPAILTDIRSKIPAFLKKGAITVDIGCGNGRLALEIIDQAYQSQGKVFLIDSDEVLSSLPGNSYVEKISGKFPDECVVEISALSGKCDAILLYSVFHYIYKSANPYSLVDAILPLLSAGGRCLIGDIPNAGMRRRFLASDNGKEHHKTYVGRSEPPELRFNALEEGAIEDSVLVGLMLYCRNAGYHSYIVPQGENLSFSNRREDLLIVKP